MKLLIFFAFVTVAYGQLRVLPIGYPSGDIGVSIANLDFNLYNIMPWTNSLNTNTSSPGNAFFTSKDLFWKSGRDELGSGTTDFAFPHLLGWVLNVSVVPGRVEFSAQPDNNCRRRGYFCGALWYQLLGSNDSPCDEWSAFDILCEDWSGEPFTRPGESKHCSVPRWFTQAYTCFAIAVLDSPFPDYATTSIRGVKMWERKLTA